MNGIIIGNYLVSSGTNLHKLFLHINMSYLLHFFAPILYIVWQKNIITKTKIRWKKNVFLLVKNLLISGNIIGNNFWQ